MEIEIVDIKNPSDNSKLQVNPETRIKDLKISLRSSMDIESDIWRNLLLFYCNETGYIQELEDENTLSYYNIPNNSTILLLKQKCSYTDSSDKISDNKCTFTMENEKGEKYDISSTHKITIIDLSYLISAHDNVKKSWISLFFNGRKLEVTIWLLADIVPNGSTIQYKISGIYKGGSMPVRLKTLTGKQENLMVDPTETVRELKLQVEEITGGMPPEAQCFICNGRQLDDEDAMLQDYSISEGSCIHLVLGRSRYYFTE